MQHNKQCDDMQRALKAFEAKWPNACKFCGGAGSLYTPGTRWEPPETDICSCIADGKCPMCMEAAVFEEHDLGDYGRCPSCGWDEWKIAKGEMKAEIAPDAECLCWLGEEF